MKLSFHNTVGKNPGPHLGSNWTNIEASWDDVFELITTDGYATSAELKSDRRTADQFVARELLMVDIDKGMSFEELFNNEFYQQYGAGYYTTPSHKDILNPRFRILFRTQHSICDTVKYVQIYKALLWMFDSADVACKDPTRLFFGTPNAEFKEKLSNTIPLEVINMLAEVGAAIEAEEYTPESNIDYDPPSDEQKQQILEFLKKIYIGNYDQWIRIGFGLKNGGFELKDFQYVTQGMMKQKSNKDCENVWKGTHATTKPCTLGTVIHFIQEHHGKDCLKMNRKDWKDTRKAIYNKYS